MDALGSGYEIASIDATVAPDHRLSSMDGLIKSCALSSAAKSASISLDFGTAEALPLNKT
jgi:hypothetical protein